MKFIVGLSIFFVFALNASLAQQHRHHIISFDISPIHYFFDGVTPFNSKEGMLNRPTQYFPFRGRFRGSVGMQYGYALNAKHEIYLGFTLFQATGYHDGEMALNQWNLFTRYIRKINVNYLRNLALNDRFIGFVGGGISYRYIRSLLGYTIGSVQSNHALLASHITNDIGIDLKLGLRAKISEKFSMSFSVDGTTINYFRDTHDNLNRLEKQGGAVKHYFPRFMANGVLGLEYRF